jgi:transposase, IS30 family
VRPGTGDDLPRAEPRAFGALHWKTARTIANEINRNGGAANYRALAAQERYESLKARPKERKLVTSSRLHDAVNEGLEQKWSPEQISARLDEEYPDDPEMKVSHETIYQTLYLQAKGELRTELKLALRQGRARRVPRSRAALSRGKIPDMVNISERPAEADDRAVPGFWEGDLIIGKGGKSQIATLVERTSRFTMLVRIPYDRCAERVAALLAKKMALLPWMWMSGVWYGSFGGALLQSATEADAGSRHRLVLAGHAACRSTTRLS